MTESLEEYINKYRQRFQDALAELEQSFQKTGFTGELISNKEAVNFSLVKDDFTGHSSLQAVWNGQFGYKQGMLLFHADGSFYGEYDVVKPHPTKKQWFVEAITVWGNNATMKSEPKLIPKP